MTDTGGTERLHYEHSTKISVSCSVIGLALAVAALFTNELVAGYTDKDDTNPDSYCGFNSVWTSSDSGYFGTYYQYICDDPDDGYSDEESDDACVVAGLGIGWLILGLIAVLLGFSSLGVYFVDKSKAAKFIEFFCSLFAAAAIIVWFLDNDYCWDSDARDDEVVRLGASIYLMMFGALAWLVAGIVAFF